MAEFEVTASSVLYLDPVEVVHDTIDGETVVVALRTGTYYTITGSGVDMWSLAAAGTRFAEALRYLQARFPTQSEGMPAVFSHWLKEMVDEGLVRVEEGSAASADHIAVDAVGAFEPPGLIRYADLQALILLDPIHEADVHTGWPNRR